MFIEKKDDIIVDVMLTSIIKQHLVPLDNYNHKVQTIRMK